MKEIEGNCKERICLKVRYGTGSREMLCWVCGRFGESRERSGAKQQQLEEAREQRYDTVIKLNILSENLKREAEPDVKDKSKMDASSSLSPHRDILQEQINESSKMLMTYTFPIRVSRRA
ncbi:hypothetical protein BASA60_002727 [Batrachochytrium salamandrivorans]|nr:hypothetical protein BASA60_002727 [Batrachochytrium salamandrivorans]